MPPRSDILKKRWPTFDLPILPFLAPRVFSTWPPRRRRHLSSAQAAPKPRTDHQSPPRNYAHCAPVTVNGGDQPHSVHLRRLGTEKSSQESNKPTPETDSTPSIDHQTLSRNLVRFSPIVSDEKDDRIATFPRQLDREKSSDTQAPTVTEPGTEASLAHEASPMINSEKKHSSGIFPRRVYDAKGSVVAKAESPAIGATVRDFVKELETPHEFLEKYEEIWSLGTEPAMREISRFDSTSAYRATGFRGYVSPLKEISALDRASLKPDIPAQGVSRSEIPLEEISTIEREDNLEPVTPAQEVSPFDPRPTDGSTSFRDVSVEPDITSLILLNEAKSRFEVGRINHRKMRFISGERPRKLVRWNAGPYSTITPEGIAWHQYFAYLNSRNESFMRGQKHPKLLIAIQDLLPDEFKRVLIEHEDSASLRASWEMIPQAERPKFWLELMRMTLEEFPDSTLKVLEATYSEPYPPDYAVGDCVNFVISHYFRNRDGMKDEDAAKVYEIISHLMRRGPRDYLHLSQSSIYLLIHSLDSAYVRVLYRDLNEFGHRLYQDTLMQFASRFAKSGETDLAVEVLKRLKTDGYDFSTEGMSSICASLLELKHRSSTTTYTEFEIFEFMLDCGLQPNTIIYNILMQNSLQSGDHDRGWKIHEIMITSGIEADEYTYSILLKDAKIRLDIPAIRRVMGLVKENGIHNAYIITDILHATYLLHQDDQRRNTELPQENGTPTAFEKMLPIYCDYFDVDQLAHIIPAFYTHYPSAAQFPSPSAAMEPGETITNMDCSTTTMFVMLTAYLQEVKHPDRTLELYHHVRELVMNGDAEVTELLRSTYTYDAILMSFGKFRETVSMCPRVVEDMLQDAAGPPQDEGVNTSSVNVGACTGEHAATDDGVIKNAVAPTAATDDAMVSTFVANSKSSTEQNYQAKPNTLCRGPMPGVGTWSILLNVFMLHRQPRAAERVLELMVERRMEPNLVVWNTLVGGYARLQDTAMAVDAVERLECAGFETDEFTASGLAKLRNRRALIETMRKKEARVQQRREEALQDSATFKALEGALKAEDVLNQQRRSEQVGTEPMEPDIVSVKDIALPKLKDLVY